MLCISKNKIQNFEVEMAHESKADSSNQTFYANTTKLYEMVIAISLVFYLSGFMIVNVYLGSLGVISFDFLREKYILIGVTFVLFVSTFLVPLKWLWNRLKNDFEKPIFSSLWEILRYSFTWYFYVFLGLFILIQLTGITPTIPVGIPYLSEPLSEAIWLSEGFLKTVMAALFLWAVFFIPMLTFFILFGLIVSLFFSKKNKQLGISKKQALHNFLSKVFSKSLFNMVLTSILVFVVVFIVLDLLVFYNHNSMTFTNNDFNKGLLSSNIPFWGKGFIRFYILSISIYLLSSISIIYFDQIINKPANPQAPVDETLRNPDQTKVLQLFNKNCSTASKILVLVIISLSIYATTVYPLLPQQIGGGGMVNIEIQTINDDLMQKTTSSDIETYLVDRSSAYTIIMLVNGNTKQGEIIQVANTEIKSITYRVFP